MQVHSATLEEVSVICNKRACMDHFLSSRNLLGQDRMLPATSREATPAKKLKHCLIQKELVSLFSQTG